MYSCLISNPLWREIGRQSCYSSRNVIRQVFAFKMKKKNDYIN